MRSPGLKPGGRQALPRAARKQRLSLNRLGTPVSMSTAGAVPNASTTLPRTASDAWPFGIWTAFPKAGYTRYACSPETTVNAAPAILTPRSPAMRMPNHIDCESFGGSPSARRTPLSSTSARWNTSRTTMPAEIPKNWSTGPTVLTVLPVMRTESHALTAMPARKLAELASRPTPSIMFPVTQTSPEALSSIPTAICPFPSRSSPTSTSWLSCTARVRPIPVGP